jgi:hypothetical protein
MAPGLTAGLLVRPRTRRAIGSPRRAPNAKARTSHTGGPCGLGSSLRLVRCRTGLRRGSPEVSIWITLQRPRPNSTSASSRQPILVVMAGGLTRDIPGRNRGAQDAVSASSTNPEETHDGTSARTHRSQTPFIRSHSAASVTASGFLGSRPFVPRRHGVQPRARSKASMRGSCTSRRSRSLSSTRYTRWAWSRACCSSGTCPTGTDGARC